MTWDAYHLRKAALQQILAVADATSEITADSALDAVPGAREAFHDADALLFDVQMYWSAQLSNQLEQLVGPGAETPEIGVVSAWVNAAAIAPGARRILDSALDNEALARAFEKEDELIARAAGVPVMSPNLLERGREIGRTARRSAVLPEIAPAEPAPVTILSWLRNTLAA
ncbi:hypothetical protein [Aeromicrobium marinum]|uniref:hypothetical protein n=1 Tax=Aeromicrobium marinum TaxID=219314 RepID=UPI000682D8D9|nr:hypothetical protein [Aeromicrobium marinum]